MLSLLIRIFIKNNEDVADSAVREKYGILCGVYGVFLNFLLFIGKLVAGILSSSIAMTADAFNNLSDAGSSLISAIGFKLAGKQPDAEHPFGHGRIEYLTGLAISGLIVMMGFELVKTSFGKIIHPEAVSFSIISIIILFVSILIKLYMSFYSRRIGKRIDSQTLLAVSTDSISDTVSTSVVLLSSLIAYFTNIKLDGIVGFLVGIVIVIAGIKSAKEVILPLLGTAPSDEFIKSVEDIVLSHDGILGIHDLIVHDYGPGRLMVTLHAEVPSDGDVKELHDIIDNIEFELATKLKCHATIHMDPITVGDPFVDELKDMVKDIISKDAGLINFHDFRVVRGNTHTNLIFDVVASFDYKISDDEIKKMVFEKVRDVNPTYICVINVDRDYTGHK